MIKLTYIWLKLTHLSLRERNMHYFCPLAIFANIAVRQEYV
jgi:hypothetical protein